MALDWPPGEIMRIATGANGAAPGESLLGSYSSTELLAELLRRAAEHERRRRVSLESVRLIDESVSQLSTQANIG
jgi:hypothetical protein